MTAITLKTSRAAPRSTPLGAVGQSACAPRMTHAEELELGARLIDCRRELLGIALLDPASSVELSRLADDVSQHAQRIDAIVTPNGDSPEAARQRLDAFRADVAQLQADCAALREGSESEPESGFFDRAGDVLPARLEACLQKSRAVVASLPLAWDGTERLLQSSWVKGARHEDEGERAPRLPEALRRRARRLEGEIEGIINRFVTANQGLVAYVVQRYRGLGLSREDLVQDGNLGLIRAVEKFDPSRGKPFGSYAVWWIREAVRRALVNQARTIRVPVHALSTRYALGQAAKRLSHRLGREPSDQELARETGVAPESVTETLHLLREPLSLDAPRSNDTESTVGDTIAASTPSPNDHAAAKERAHQLSGLLEGLTPREQEVLRQRFGLDGDDERTLEQIGRSFDLTRERVRQIVVQALGKLHRETQARRLEL